MLVLRCTLDASIRGTFGAWHGVTCLVNVPRLLAIGFDLAEFHRRDVAASRSVHALRRAAYPRWRHELLDNKRRLSSRGSASDQSRLSDAGDVAKGSRRIALTVSQQQATDRSSDDAESERWAAQLLMQSLDAEQSRRTRIVDRGHAALLAYAAEAWAITSVVQFANLTIASKVACAILALCGPYVLIYWHQMSRVQSVKAFDHAIFGDLTNTVTPWSGSPAQVRCHLLTVLAGLSTDNATLSTIRKKLHETLLIAVVAGGCPLVEQFFFR